MAKETSRPGIARNRSVAGNGRPDDIDGLSSLVSRILVDLGEDPDRNGLLKTPERVAKALQFMTQRL